MAYGSATEEQELKELEKHGIIIFLNF